MDGKTPDGPVVAAGDAVDQLDRLTGLTQVIAATLVQEVLQATNRSNPRACLLSHEVTTWIVLAMGLLTDLPIRSVYQHARRLQPGDPIPTRGALCLARRRLGIAPLRALFQRVVRPLTDDQLPGATFGGLRLVGIDGTKLDVPDTPANVAAFGRPRGGRGDGAFPQVHKVSLVELGSRAELAFVVKPCARNEAARQEPIDPDRLSFTGALRVLRCRLPECDSRRPEVLAAWFRRLLWEIREQPIEPRRSRVNPRVVKHQVSNYAKKHPHHRGVPSARKPFLESVVMLI